MQPTMILKFRSFAALRQRQGFGQSAGLVELDVDGIIFSDEFVKAVAVMG